VVCYSIQVDPTIDPKLSALEWKYLEMIGIDNIVKTHTQQGLMGEIGIIWK
jgi:hypothetical protein